jgi:Rha family phage regulatory protein
MTDGIDATRMPIVRMTDAGEAMADSRDVAAYFGKNHFDLLKAVRNLDCSPQFRERNFASFKIKDLTGESTSHVSMTKDGFNFLVMGFTGAKAAAYKEAYIAQFNMMEAELRSRQFDPKSMLANPSALKSLLLESMAETEQLRGQVSALTPKAEALDRFVTASGSLCITDAAKVLGLRPKFLHDWLKARGWIYRRASIQGWIAHEVKIKAGILEPKSITIIVDGVETLSAQARVTAKGLAELARRIPAANQPPAAA